MTAVICPHCSASNVAGSAFCESCGKALPAAIASSPRILSGASLAVTGVGQKLQSDELRKQLNKASGALLTVAILQTAFGALIVFALQNARGGGRLNMNAIFVTIFGVAALFWALWIWSRFNPLPAAIVGLVVYVTLWLLDIVMYVVQASNVPANAGPVASGGPLNGIFMKIIIIAILSRAIGAGVKYRNLQRQQMTL